MNAKGEVAIPVAGAFKDGDVLQDAYTGRTATVAGGAVKLQAEGYVLLERVR